MDIIKTILIIIQIIVDVLIVLAVGSVIIENMDAKTYGKFLKFFGIK